MSKAEQKQRFKDRLEDPAKHWKFSFADLKEREHWAEYQDAFEQMLQHTSTKWAPWWVIPADNKWVTRALVAGIITNSIDALGVEPPAVSADRANSSRRPRKRSPDMKRLLAGKALRSIFLCTATIITSSAYVVAQAPAPSRPQIGVAFGGGSARGFAHVGVIRWFEEHHIPIDLAAGTSMGGLVGGSFATGMSSSELEVLLAETDWDKMFGASSFRFKNIRRKQDARAYPSRLEFGLKKGLGLPSSLNNGQQVDLLLAKITAAYAGMTTFDDLPTPFRCLAVDLTTANQVVLDRGSMARAMRATMSLPGIFPPVPLDGRVLVDGGAMNNVPADVVRSMGADVVIAINVGSMSETRAVSQSLFGLIGGTIDAMMIASTRRGMAAADIVINPQLDGFGSLDWRRTSELVQAGYQAAEAMREKLLPLAVDDTAWQEYVQARTAKRRTAYPTPRSLQVIGATRADERRIRTLLEPRLNQPIDPTALQVDFDVLSGLDAYEMLNWDVVQDGDQPVLVVRATAKPHAPPFLMLSINLQNTTSEDFSFQLAGRYLAYDVLGAGSELRLDAGVGSIPTLAAGLYHPFGSSPMFWSIGGGVLKRRFNLVSEDVVVASYADRRAFARFDLGLNLGRDSEVRVGLNTAHIEAERLIGNPLLPNLSGHQGELVAHWVYDSQDNVAVPSSGSRVKAAIRQVLDAPLPPPEVAAVTSNEDLTQAEVEGSKFWPRRAGRDRLFVNGGLGTSFNDHPLPTDQFQLGLPLRLGAFDVGERRGSHYAAVSAGYLLGIGRLPDFLGGPIFVGGWVENGSAFEKLSAAQLSTHLGFGVVAETLFGPALAGTSIGFDGNRRYYISLGRLF